MFGGSQVNITSLKLSRDLLDVVLIEKNAECRELRAQLDRWGSPVLSLWSCILTPADRLHHSLPLSTLRPTRRLIGSVLSRCSICLSLP